MLTHQDNLWRIVRQRKEKIDQHDGRPGFLKKRPALTSVPTPTCIPLKPVLLASAKQNSFTLPLVVTGEGRNANKQFEMNALIDSGAGGTFIDKKFTEQNGITLIPIEKKIQIFNADGTENNSGTIENCIWLKIQMGKKKISTRFLVTELEKDKMILGLPWLKQYNPKIDWNTGKVNINSIHMENTFSRMFTQSVELARMEVVKPRPRPDMEEIFENIDHLPTNKPLPDNGPILEGLLESSLEDEAIWIQAKTSISQGLAHQYIDDKAKVKLPEIYAEYRTIFEKEASERMPERKAWDHTIDLKTDFIPKDCKIYPLSPEEQKEQDKFLKENLRKGYI